MESTFHPFYSRKKSIPIYFAEVSVCACNLLFYAIHLILELSHSYLMDCCNSLQPKAQIYLCINLSREINITVQLKNTNNEKVWNLKEGKK